jgi:hypothetical protein
MSDLSKCQNMECPSHQQCWRYLCPADGYWQAYAAFAPEEGGERCDYFIDAAEWQKGGKK